MKKTKVALVVLIVAVFLTEAVNIYYSNTVSIESISVKEIEEQIEVIEEENKALRADLFALTSFDIVASKAAQIGFVEAEEYISLYDPLEVASR